VCIPGLSGDSKEIYCVCVAKECLQRNLDFAVINYRGTSGVPIKVRKF
jgi:predicted alpha/beta-fold hydrolase